MLGFFASRHSFDSWPLDSHLSSPLLLPAVFLSHCVLAFGHGEQEGPSSRNDEVRYLLFSLSLVPLSSLSLSTSIRSRLLRAATTLLASTTSPSRLPRLPPILRHHPSQNPTPSQPPRSSITPSEPSSKPRPTSPPPSPTSFPSNPTALPPSVSPRTRRPSL